MFNKIDGIRMIIGIDLGTTNSLVAIWENGKSIVIPNSLNEYLTPSVVGLDDDGEIIVGQAAKERLLSHPNLTVANVKRYMGSDKVVTLGARNFRPEEISALILKTLKADAEAYLNEEVVEAVVTVPAYFNDIQRKATKIAGELSGLKVERLLNEPTAAALAYGLHEEKENRFLIFDLGGGTFDISIVEYFDGLLEVHASAGDNVLGGEDFTSLIKHHLIAHQTDEKIKEKQDDPFIEQLLTRKAEFIKRQLGESGHCEITFQVDDIEISWKLSSTEFEKLAEPLLKRLSTPIRRALRDSKFKVKDLDQIVLVGGATRMSIVRSLTTKLFERFPVFELDPDQVVAIGAGIQAGLKSRDSALDDTVMTDVCPYSLGIEVSQGQGSNVSDGFFLPVIERNNFIPISRMNTVYAAEDNQTVIHVNVYQGENPMVKDNVFLERLIVKVPKNKAYEEAIDLRFTYDINGLLEVDVTVQSTMKKTSMTIEKNPGMLSKAEIAECLKKLEKLKIHPRDKLPNQALINRANRIYQEYLGNSRQEVSARLSQFMNVLNGQDERELKEARKEFKLFLDNFEDHLI